MQEFIHRKNLEHYRKLLAGTANDEDRRILQKLIMDEESKDKPPRGAPNGEQL
ncbi:MAG: hypothetical protein ACHQ50_17585 [Fimbriimonadales bacterium]